VDIMQMTNALFLLVLLHLSTFLVAVVGQLQLPPARRRTVAMGVMAMTEAVVCLPTVKAPVPAHG